MRISASITAAASYPTDELIIIFFIERGVCHLARNGELQLVGDGGIVLFRPGYPQIYSFLASEQSISHYAHFTGISCAMLLHELGIEDIRVFDM